MLTLTMRLVIPIHSCHGADPLLDAVLLAGTSADQMCHMVHHALARQSHRLPLGRICPISHILRRRFRPHVGRKHDRPAADCAAHEAMSKNDDCLSRAFALPKRLTNTCSIGVFGDPWCATDAPLLALSLAVSHRERPMSPPHNHG